ncbi:site-specific DNA-methyltransferase [Mariniflexile maritimum]|uniref:site-specific DNA-methyltransferase n=1 Tax=Mariniflexile maritimum TaxID=2682493 RepID=UPI0012F6E2C1|nr:site-specific DNA-methyltransferase [Mariniflexile maritimum]
MAEQEFINAGYTVVGTENNENKLLSFLKENYPNVISDTEINLEELKTVLGLPIDEKVNGYGLNFVGRNFARAKYAQKTEKELRLNNTLSKNIDTTENLVLKGDNLDSLKILKNHYSGKIKCIYIDPPYNTDKDEFVYPDKFDKEEAEVLGLANLSEGDFARMDFSFKSKKSHNGWLAFMYPRLLLARDLLSKDGVIFISIDDNEQANLKLLCDDVFGEENFVANIIWEKKFAPSNDAKWFSDNHDHILIYSKSKELFRPNLLERNEEALNRYKNPDNDSRGAWVSGDMTVKTYNSNYDFEITTPSGRKVSPPKGICWRFSKEKVAELILENRVWFGANGDNVPRLKRFLNEVKEGITPLTIWYHKDVAHNQEAAQELRKLFEGELYFETPKPIRLIKRIIHLASKENEIVLDFFAGSGTTGHAVMQLNAEDGGNRKFILCQIDEPIDKKKPAYKFCIDNKLPPVISSITIERLKRAGEKIKNSLNRDLPDSRDSNDLFSDNQGNQTNQNNHSSDNNQNNHSLDIGFKVFDSVEAPKLKVDDKGQISFTENHTDALSRIYNMIFTVGLDEPTQVPEEVVKDCIYKIGNHYYITNSENITSDDFSNAIKNGKVFIDGWTASLNGTLQNYKEDVKIVF